jgi:hypothetical protein
MRQHFGEFFFLLFNGFACCSATGKRDVENVQDRFRDGSRDAKKITYLPRQSVEQKVSLFDLVESFKNSPLPSIRGEFISQVS